MPTPTHPRRSWFAVWLWPRGTWIALLPALIVLYALSAVPVGTLLSRAGMLYGPMGLHESYSAFYKPFTWCAHRFIPLQQMMGWQHDVIGRLTGESQQRKVRTYLYAPANPLSPPHSDEWKYLGKPKIPATVLPKDTSWRTTSAGKPQRDPEKNTVGSSLDGR